MTDSTTRDELAERLRGELPAIEANTAALSALVQSLLSPAVAAALAVPGAGAPLAASATSDVLAASAQASQVLRRVDAQLAPLRFGGAA